MIPVLTRTRAKSLDEFGKLVHHSGEEYIHVLEGRLEVHTEFYDPIVLGPGESVYIDSNMGHAYIAAEGCDEAVLLGVCSSADEQLLRSEEHTSELQSLMRISYAVFCLKKKTYTKTNKVYLMLYR